MFNFVYTSFDDEITVSGQDMDDEKTVSFRGQLNF